MDKINEKTTDLITVLQTINSITLVVHGILNAIDELKNGNPGNVDVERLRQILLELPDLPVEE